VISATASREPILTKAMLQNALKARKHKPMFLLDLAVPRDIAADVAELPDVYLYTVDDLEQVIEDNRASRREAANEAEVIIDLQVQHFWAWSQAQGNQNALKNLRAHGVKTRDALLEQAREQLANGQDPHSVIAVLAHQLTNKLLHAPTTALRHAALRGDADLLRAAEKLYSNDDQNNDK